MECKYKFQSIEKFAGKPYCTLHNETCEFINFVCDKNCQVYEDYKQLKAKEQECEELKKDLDFQKNMYECARADEKDKFEEILELKQTLAEIKEIAEDFGFNGTYTACYTGIQKILQKINEVENVENS